MKLIKPSVTIIDEPNTLKRIELAGRTCYKSEDKITRDSAKSFVDKIIKRGHESVLEHSNIVVRTNGVDNTYHLELIIADYEQTTGNPAYIRHDGAPDRELTSRGVPVYGTDIFSGNVRAWRNIAKKYKGEVMIQELFMHHVLFQDIGFDVWSHPQTDYTPHAQIIPFSPGEIHNIITARFICDRGVSHELVRHRVQSFSQESTRYVKYGDDMEFIEPWWWEDESGAPPNTAWQERRTLLSRAMQSAMNVYIDLIDSGVTPQFARSVLPNALKTEVVITSTIKQWRAWLKLRDDRAAHPDMQRIAKLFKEATGLTKETRQNGNT